MLRSVADHGHEHLAFALSFVVIAAHWRAHHEVFRYVRSLSDRLTSLTLAWLFMQVLMPFATRVITADGAFPPRFSLYASVQVLASALIALMIREIRREHLYSADVPPLALARSRVRSICLAAVFGVSVPVSFLTTSTGAYLCCGTEPDLAERERGRGRVRRAPVGSGRHLGPSAPPSWRGTELAEWRGTGVAEWRGTGVARLRRRPSLTNPAASTASVCTRSSTSRPLTHPHAPTRADAAEVARST